jgi:hypothetical protein
VDESNLLDGLNQVTPTKAPAQKAIKGFSFKGINLQEQRGLERTRKQQTVGSWKTKGQRAVS